MFSSECICLQWIKFLFDWFSQEWISRALIFANGYLKYFVGIYFREWAIIRFFAQSNFPKIAHKKGNKIIAAYFLYKNVKYKTIFSSYKKVKACVVTN